MTRAFFFLSKASCGSNTYVMIIHFGKFDHLVQNNRASDVILRELNIKTKIIKVYNLKVRKSIYDLYCFLSLAAELALC